MCNVPLDYLKTLVSEGLPIDRIQRPLSPLWSREYEETAKFCREKGIEVAVYSPSGMGLLSGRYLQAGDLNDARATLFCCDPRCIGPYHELLDLVLEIARGKLTTGTQVALSWTKAKNPDIVILGARNERQLRENLSNDVPLTEQELSDLDNAARNLDMASNEVCANMFSYDW